MVKKLFLCLPLAILLLLLNSKPSLALGINSVTDPLPSSFTLGGIISLLLPTVIVLAGMVATLLIIWGGFKYMTAQGDPKAVSSARSTITGAVIGLLIILSIGVIGFIIQQVFRYNIFTGVVS